MFEKNLWIANYSNALETISQPKPGIVRRVIGFFSFTQEDRLKAGIHICSKEDGDEHSVSSYFLRTPSERID
jgi:hypothetical protein